MPKLRWYQYRLRTLFLLILIVAISMSWFATNRHRAEQQMKAVEEIERIGGIAYYDYQQNFIADIIRREFEFGPIEPGLSVMLAEGDPPGPEWLRIHLGVDFFSNIKLVNLDHCHEKGFHHLKEPVDGLRYVETLHLSGNSITDEELEHFSALPRLIRLSLCSDQITNSGFRIIDKYQQLQCLVLYKCPNIKASGYKSLSKLTKLKTLIMTENDAICDTGFKFLEDLTHLEELSLSNCSIKNAGLKYLKDLKTLKKLDLSFCVNLNNDSLKYLKDLRNLSFLDISYDRRISGDGLSYLNGLPKLRELYLQDTDITDSTLEKLNDLPELETLALDGTSTTGISLNLEKSKKIKDLSLGSCHITDAGLKHVSKLTSLERLDVSDNSQLTDSGLTLLCKLTSLEELNLSGNSGITDAGLKLLCKLTSLEVLELSNNSQITDAGIEYLNSLRKLQYLDLTNTKTTAAGVKRLQQLLPKCNIQHREATIPLESEKRDTKSKDEGITDVDAPKLLDTPGCGDYDYSIGTDAGVKHLAKIKELII